MSGLFSVLSSASTALNAQSEAIAVTSNNIANLNNPDYARETVVYNDLPSVTTANGVQSAGVDVSVQQSRDAILDQMVQQQASLTSGFQAQQNILEQAQASLGEDITNSSTSSSTSSTSSVSTSGLSSALSDFFNAFQSYASDPTDTDTAQTLVQQAGVLTDRFQQIDQSLSQVQQNASAEATSSVSSANTLLQQIGQLNAQIASAAGNPTSPPLNLIDQREGDLEQLAGLMPISTQQNAQGEDQVSTTDTQGNPVILVNNGQVVNSLSFANGVVSAGSTALGLSSGSIEGTLSASSGAVQALQTSVDQLAQQIVTAVNQAYNPTDAAGGNFFDASGLTAGTIAVDSNLTASSLHAGTGTAGDNSIALAVANVVNQQFSTSGGDAINGTLTQFYAGAVSNIGQALDTANTQATDQANVQTTIVNQRQSVSGVSLDEEMSNLMTYQNAYQAASQIFQVVDTLLSDFVNDLSSV